MSDSQYLRLLEAVLFASAEPIPEAVLRQHLPEEADVESLLGELKGLYAERGVNLRQAGRGWAFRTAPDLGAMLRAERSVARKLSRAAVEVLAIVAYHQPVTRAEIEEIRGVGLSKGTLDVLFEAGWIRPKGRRRTPGRPVTWGTTDGFLDHFGLASLGDLPGADDLKAAGLLDKRAAIEALGGRGNLGLVPSAEGEDAPEDETEATEEPLDPDDGPLSEDEDA